MTLGEFRPDRGQSSFLSIKGHAGKREKGVKVSNATIFKLISIECQHYILKCHKSKSEGT